MHSKGSHAKRKTCILIAWWAFLRWHLTSMRMTRQLMVWHEGSGVFSSAVNARVCVSMSLRRCLEAFFPPSISTPCSSSEGSRWEGESHSCQHSLDLWPDSAPADSTLLAKTYGGLLRNWYRKKKKKKNSGSRRVHSKSERWRTNSPKEIGNKKQVVKMIKRKEEK